MFNVFSPFRFSALPSIGTLAAVFCCGFLSCADSAKAQTLVDVWDYDGGAFNPATYGGVFRPPVLVPNVAQDSGATLVLSNLRLGGLGSGSFPEGYGGIYTFFSENVGFAMQTTQILPGIQTITASFQAGGGTYDASTALLAFNLENPAVASSAYFSLNLGVADSPIGLVEMIQYTWTWDIAALGASSGFTIHWTANEHEFFDEVSLTQAIPEPSTFVLLGIGAVVILTMIRRSAKCRA